MSTYPYPYPSAAPQGGPRRLRPPGPGAELAVPGEPAVAHQPLRLAWPGRLAAALVATDIAAIALALLVAQFGRFGATRSALPDDGLSYAAFGAAAGTLWLICLTATRSRDSRVIGVGLGEYQRLLNAALWTFGILAIVAFLAKADVARGYLAIALPAGLLFLVAGRAFWRRRVALMRRDGRCLTGVIVVGSAADVRRAVTQLRVNLDAGYRPIGASLTGARDPDDDPVGLPLIPLDEVARVSRLTRTRAVMIAGSLPGGHEQVRDLSWQLEDSQVELILLSRLTDVAGPRMHMRPVQHLPMMHVDLPRYSGFNYAVKRLGDVVAAGVAILLLSPVLLLIAALVRMTGPGPVVFRQQRVGVRGGVFEMLKFRSMVVDAESRLQELRTLDQGNGVLFKVKADPRVTGVGRILRRYSLDELPQLFNVLRGDMSLIGPRPPLPSEVEQYADRVNRRLLIKPGITGLWQVSGRSNLSWEESVKLDLYYVENWSVTGDLVILLRTIRAVLTQDGAY